MLIISVLEKQRLGDPWDLLPDSFASLESSKIVGKTLS